MTTKPNWHKIKYLKHHCIKSQNFFKRRFAIFDGTACIFPTDRHNQIPTDYVGAMSNDTVLDSTHYKLRDPPNRVLLEKWHINRLKLAFVSPLIGMVNTQQQLSKAIQSTNPTNVISNSGRNIQQ